MLSLMLFQAILVLKQKEIQTVEMRSKVISKRIKRLKMQLMDRNLKIKRRKKSKKPRKKRKKSQRKKNKGKMIRYWILKQLLLQPLQRKTKISNSKMRRVPTGQIQLHRSKLKKKREELKKIKSMVQKNCIEWLLI